jgi:LAGLIDADG endonuclease
MPRGVSDKLKKAFPLNIVETKPDYNPDLNKINVHWIAGFINADGHFGLSVYKSSKTKIGEKLGYSIRITQHNKSVVVLERIKEFLQMGTVVLDKTIGKNVSHLIITHLRDINRFIEIFKPAQFQGSKALDYADFCKGIQIINKKEHLTREGINNLKILISNRNSLRVTYD